MKKILKNRLVISFVILPLIGYAAKKISNYFLNEKPMNNKVEKFKDELQNMKHRNYGNLNVKPNKLDTIANL